MITLHLPPKQHGAALVISLIILAVVTVLSVSAMRGTTLETKVAVNHQFKQMSFQAAESALAILTGDDPDVTVPKKIGDPVEKNSDYYTYAGSTYEPSSSADLTMDLKEKTDDIHVHGFEFGQQYLIFQADSIGSITGSGARTHNRMDVALPAP